MLKRVFAYIRNKSEEPKVLKHPLFASKNSLFYLPAHPGHSVPVENNAVTVQPGQIVRVPYGVWNQMPSAWRLPWTEEVPESEFLSMCEQAMEGCAGKCQCCGQSVGDEAE